MVEIMFKFMQECPSLLHRRVWVRRIDLPISRCIRVENLVGGFRKRRAILRERKASVNEMLMDLQMEKVDKCQQENSKNQRSKYTFNNFAFVSIHSFKHVSKKST